MYQMDDNNRGGVAAKKGFFFQDYVATFLATEMLLDRDIKGIGCEVGDDIEIFHSDNSITHVQVKTGTVSNHWTLSELKAPRNVNQGGKAQPNSSILHKSLELDKTPNILSKFVLVTDKPVSGPLCFLEIPHEKRALKSGREGLIKSINTALGKKFQSGNGHRGEYWVDKTLWRVFPNVELIILKTEHNLRIACEELLNCTLSTESIKQLGEILCNKIYSKSQLSKKINTVEDKTLFRQESISILHSYTLSKALVTKAYPNNQLADIVTSLFEEVLNKHKNKGFKQEFNFNVYRYDYIVDMLIKWLDEVFLKPSEMVGNDPTLIKAETILKRISDLELNKVISKVIFNSILRKQSQAQPIPMIMFAANNNKILKFDSVHIVKNDKIKDELWIGVNEFIENNDDVFSTMNKICDKLYELVFIDMDTDRQVILESKEDKYLYKHEIDSILDTSNSFSSHLDRFKFVIFLSYKMQSYDHQTCEDALIQEIKNKASYMYDYIIRKNQIFEKIRLGFYLFPTPCNDTILNRFKSRVFP
ncbi:dsDNA nuclease domain-containing protein [Aeromonas sp. 61P]|uniref:dsDNA nuclease domain-containing protein n=1 Tax=Aeromonas sp. 61P TaxID=3452721 RepID=UPI003F796624